MLLPFLVLAATSGIPLWPSAFPNPLLSGYDLETGDPTARTDMESGAARVRRRNTGVPDHVTLSVLLSDEQMIDFRAFWNDEWRQGAAWVFFPIKDGFSAGINNKECRPTTGKFKATPIKLTYWQVQIAVEVRNA